MNTWEDYVRDYQRALKKHFLENYYQKDVTYNIKFVDDMLIVAGYKRLESDAQYMRYYHFVFADMCVCIYDESNVVDYGADVMSFDDIKRKCSNQLKYYLKKLNQ